MSCLLSKTTSYNVGRVIHDNNTGSYTAQLVNPPASCPDNVFVSKKAELQVVEGANPELIFSYSKNKPVIIVPRSEYVEQIGSSGFGLTALFIFFGLILLGLGAILLVRRRQIDDGTLATIGGGSPRPSLGGGSASGLRVDRGFPNPYPSRPSANPIPSGNGSTTIVNNNSGNNGLVEGMVLGELLSNRGGERTVIERERIIERESSTDYSSDDNSGSSFSSDSDDSSSSSFSSDSDSDSGSSFGSDDGGSSFGSDSGGGSFGSDD